MTRRLRDRAYSLSLCLLLMCCVPVESAMVTLDFVGEITRAQIEPSPSACGLSCLGVGSPVTVSFSYDDETSISFTDPDSGQFIDAIFDLRIEVGDECFLLSGPPADAPFTGVQQVEADGSTREDVFFEGVYPNGEFFILSWMTENLDSFDPHDLTTYADVILNASEGFGGILAGDNCFIDLDFSLTPIPEPGSAALAMDHGARRAGNR